jgi:hypothetical protein
MSEDLDDLDCKKVSRLISDGQDKLMSPPDRARLRLHFVICQNCRDVEGQLNFLRAAMQRLGRNEPHEP